LPTRWPRRRSQGAARQIVTSIELGIFSRTFSRPTLGAVLDTAIANGFRLIHFNFRSAGMSALPMALTEEDCVAIRSQAEGHGVRLAGVSATFNAIHPDQERRAAETQAAASIIRLAPALGTNLVSLSTGTRDTTDMWQGHPANQDPSAWADLRQTLQVLLRAAGEAGVVLGIEPEEANVVSSATRARRLMDELADDNLKIVLDPANLLTAERAGDQAEILQHAFQILGPDIVVLHAKDFSADGHVAAGRGLLDYGTYLELVDRHGVRRPLMIHEVEESDVPRARDFILNAARSVPGVQLTLGSIRGTSAMGAPGVVV
jgi:sugar phosphate isomerase/epimerase